MLKKFAIILVALVATTTFFGCNQTDDTENEITYASTMVRSFKLKPNAYVLSALDTVFFSIDLANAKIFNADSLPYGTRIDKLVVDIATDACKTVELTMRKNDGADTIVNYLTNSTDSINFANGPVNLRVVSYDGKAERNYEIKVNVHTVIPDSLCWSEIAMRPLPTSLSNITAQRSVATTDKAVCLTTNGTDFCIATTADPATEQWEPSTPNFQFNPDINSLTAAEATLFILDDAGALYSSDDLGATWNATGETWSAIVGNYGSTLLGLSYNGAKYMHVTYPATTVTEAEEKFPVSGFSSQCTITSRWTQNQQKVIAGGRDAAGNLNRLVWGFDGTNWAVLSKSLPIAVEHASLIKFNVAKTDTLTWQTRQIETLLLIGGKTPKGISNTTYISHDLGINWKQADDLLQLPEYIQPRYNAQALVYNTTMSVNRAASVWQPYPAKQLPGWWLPIDYAPNSRAVAPIEEWECPYIYLFGGYNSQGNLFDSVWKGTIRRLMFQPLQ